MTEAQFQRAVTDLARLLGWGTAEDATGELTGLIYHPQLAKWSERGWPDLTLIRRRDGRVIFAELKSERGKVTARQHQVHSLLLACGLDVRVWRPADFDEIAAVLR
jgi:hypothetical protein